MHFLCNRNIARVASTPLLLLSWLVLALICARIWASAAVWPHRPRPQAPLGGYGWLRVKYTEDALARSKRVHEFRVQGAVCVCVCVCVWHGSRHAKNEDRHQHGTRYYYHQPAS